MHEFVLYSRSYCHLCDDMLQALRMLNGEFEFKVKVIDVDASEDLVALYDELVPVLVGKVPDMPDRQLCHYLLDTVEVRAFLGESLDEKS